MTAPSYDEVPSWPKAILPMSKEAEDKFSLWLDEWLTTLIASQQPKLHEWAEEEKAYNAAPETGLTIPFEGACGDTVPLIAMGVDPIHARLDTGIFKTDPPFRLKPLRKDLYKYSDSVERYLNYYLKHHADFRTIASPRFLELVKHGTCVFKTCWDRVEHRVMTYDPKTWDTVEKTVRTFDGPRIYGVSIKDFLFPPQYQDLQSCPVVAERQRLTEDALLLAEHQGKLANVKKVIAHTTADRDPLSQERILSVNHDEDQWARRAVEVYEIWCDYDYNGDGLPERLVVTYHPETRTFLQRRFNWYFHQRKPYTIIQYTITNDSLYGLGIAKMSKPMQDMLTKWHRIAQDSGYLSNIRMFIAKRDDSIEEVPKLYPGRVFKVDNPREDFIPFSAAENIYPSALQERQNIIGLNEKRTGVSDYLTGRESSIVGSRATATSTLALIQEGTRRVEEVLENIRHGCAEIMTNCLWIWMQYGPGSLLDIAFEDDKVAQDVRAFLDAVKEVDVGASFAVDLGASDAMGSRASQQQTQLAVIQVMMQYLKEVFQLGQLAVQSQAQMPPMAAWANEVASAGREMFKDLLSKYDIPNPDAYLPDLEAFLGAQGASPGAAGPAPVEPPMAGLSGTLTPPSGPSNSYPGFDRARARVAAAAGSDFGLPASPIPPQ